MTWQKARLKQVTIADGVPMNTEFWVVAVEPIMCPYDCDDHDHSGPGYITNVISNRQPCLAGIRAAAVELLGEGADDVTLVPWEQFSKL